MRAGLLGLGRMGLRHLEVLQGLKMDVVGASDLQEQARTKAAADFGLAQSALFADGREMIEKTRPELLVVATTAPAHAELVCLGAKNGAKAILCEKPMAVSLAECDRMLEACAAAGTKLAVNHQMRFMEQYTRTKQIIEDPSFGGLASATVVTGNCGIAMNGSHYFEMFRYLTGEMPANVSAWFSPETVANPRGAQFEDRGGTVRVTTASGRRLYIDASTDQGHGMHATYAGPNGRLTIDELAGNAHLSVRKSEHRGLPTTRYGMPADEQAIAITPADSTTPTRSVLEALLAGSNYPDGVVGRMAVEVLAAAYASHEQGGKAIELASARLPRERTFPWA